MTDFRFEKNCLILACSYAVLRFKYIHANFFLINNFVPIKKSESQNWGTCTTFAKMYSGPSGPYSDACITVLKLRLTRYFKPATKIWYSNIYSIPNFCCSLKMAR